MFTFNIDIKLDKLEGLSGEIEDTVSYALEKEADRGVNFAHALVPVDTGQLRTSIHRPDNAKEVDGSLEVEIIAGGESAFYAGFIEYGTVKMAPRPYMTPTAETIAMELPSAISMYLVKILR